MAFKVDRDHWAFLEDIEAPLWSDLSLEANSNVHDIEDEWFDISHEFHQRSSSHLKYVFSHGGDESTSFGSELLGTSSPKLPNSVSKSRGKQYKSRKWKGDIQGISFDKGHPVKTLTGKSTCTKLGPEYNKAKHTKKSIHSGETCTKPNVVSERSIKGKAVSYSSESLSSREKPSTSLTNDANKTSEINPTSTVTTSESCREQSKVVDGLSRHTFGETSDLLSMMKKCLRKSFVTRRATRVEIKKDGKQPIGRSSTSSNKSSVGSSSNPRYDMRVSMSKLGRSKEITPDSKNKTRMACVVKIEEGASNNRRCQVNPAKQKVQRPKALVPSKVNAPNSTLASMEIKKKTAMVASRRLARDGKENVNGRMSVTEKSGSGKNIVAGTISSKGKGRDRGNLEKQKKPVQRPHFR